MLRILRKTMLLLVVFLLGAASALVAVDAARGTTTQEVRFEPAKATGEHPFTEPAILGVHFGGTGDNERCDPELLIASLQARPEVLRAWARVQGITPDEVPDFIRSLHPVVLTEHTRVTNHMWKDGKIVAFQSILEAGTAVLVDDEGKIRVRCRCGNPIDIPDCPDCDKPDCPEGDPRCEKPECREDDPRCDEPDCPDPEPYDSTLPLDDECPPPDDDCEPVPGTTGYDPCKPDCPENSTVVPPGCATPEPRRPNRVTSTDPQPDPDPAPEPTPKPERQPRDPQEPDPTPTPGNNGPSSFGY